MTVALLMAPFGALASEGAKGWYLMEPPVDETSDLGFGVLDQAPLTQWARIATYSTEAACESRRNEAVSAALNEIVRLSKTSPLPKIDIWKGAGRDRRLAEASSCVSADAHRFAPGSAATCPNVSSSSRARPAARWSLHARQ